MHAEPNSPPRLLVVSEYPHHEYDFGVMQRVAAIDGLFADTPRLYLFVSFKRVLRRRVETRGPVRVEWVNYFLHQRYIVKLLEHARWIYVHNCLNGIKLIPHYRRFGPKIIADLHGVVPEEIEFLGEPITAKIFQMVERQMVRHCRLLVVVTRRMGQHFLDKYPGYADASRIIVLPNFNFRNAPAVSSRHPEGESPDLRLIYAGSAGKWQNLDLMLEVLARLKQARPGTRASLFVPRQSLPELAIKIGRLGLNGSVELGSRSPEGILEEYARADAGFVLRDDILLNRVAMPTKLVEYINYGIVPIVLSPDIGDFPDYGYRYLTIDNLSDPQMTESDRLEEMRQANVKCLAAIYADASKARDALRTLIEGSHAGVTAVSGTGA